MTTTTLTLADFLLARIDTDSERARLFEESALLARDSLGYPTCGRDPVMSLRPSHVRVQAECEAKRRIVADWQTFQRAHEESAEGTPLPQSLTMAGIVKGYERAVAALASVYADHPDYRDEWRP